MGTTLTGKKVQNTYDSLIKITDNDTLTGSAKRITDGLGTNSPIYLSTTRIGIGMSPTIQFETSGDAKIGNDLTVGGDLTVNGTTTFIDSTIVEIGDNMIELAKDNTANTKDIGWYGTINDGSEKYVGVFYDASTGTTTPEFKIGIGTTEPGNIATWTTKGKLVIGDIDSTGGSFSGHITIPETPTADGHAASKKYVDDSTGSSEVAERIEITVKNKSGATLSKGVVVHVSPTASPPSGNVVEVIKADYDDADKMPAIGILKEGIANDNEGTAVMFGALSGIDTSSFSAGDELYVGNDGALTSTKPTNTNQLIQKIGVCVKSHASNGLIKIFGAGRSNDVPNKIDRDIQADGDIRFLDTRELQFGTDNDLNFKHNGSNATINNKTGQLNIYQLQDDGDIKFFCDDGAGGTENYFQIDGGEQRIKVFNEMRFSDSVELRLGTGSDLRIYHDAANSYIKDTGTGSLKIQATNLNLQNDTGESYIDCVSNAQVQIYYDNSKKFETTSSGVTVTGSITTGRNINLSSTDYAYIQGTHTSAADGEYVMRVFGYGDSNFYGSFDILRHDENDGEIRLRTKISGTNTNVLSIVDGNSTFAGDVTANHYFADTHFRSTDTAATLSTTGAGIVYLRPNGYNSTTGQFTLDNSGNGTFAGTIKQTGKALTIEANDPEIVLKDTDEGADDKVFRIINVSEELRFTARTDSNGANADGGDVLKITRAGNATFAGAISAGDEINVNLSSEGKYFEGGSGNLRRLSITSGTNISAHALHTFNIASSNGKYEFDVNGTTEFSLDSSSATFAGNVDLGNSSNIGMSSASAGQLRVLGNGYTGAIALDGNAMHIYHNSSSRDLILGTNETARLTIDGGNGNATFSGEIKQSTRTTIHDNGTITWGSSNNFGELSWDGDYALYRGRSGKGIKLQTNGSTDALTIDTSQNATFSNDVTINGGDLTIAKQNDAPTMTLLHDGTNPSTNDLLFKMQFQSDYNGSHQNWGKIEVDTNASAVRTNMDFYVKSSGGNEQLALRLEGQSSAVPNATFAGDVTINGSHLTLANGTTSAQSTDYLYIGGSNLASADAAIYIGNQGAGGGYGYRIYYSGVGTGNNNKLILKSENLGTEVDMLTFTADGNATFSGEVTATEYNLPSGGMLDWANGDARIVEGEINNYSLSFKTYDGSTVSTALRLDGDNTATFSGEVFIDQELNVKSSNGDLEISGDTSGNVYHNSKSGEHRWRANGSSVNSMTLSSSQLTINEATQVNGNLTIASGNLFIPQYIYHDGDTNTRFEFQSDQIYLRTGGTDRLILTNDRVDFQRPVVAPNLGRNNDDQVLFAITEADTNETIRRKFGNLSLTALTRVDDATAPAEGCFQITNQYYNVSCPEFFKVDDNCEYTFEVWVKFVSGTDTDQRLYAGSSFYDSNKTYLGNSQRYWGESGEQIDANSRNNGEWWHFSGTLGPSRGTATGNIPNSA
jgi:predicted transcriptional regulator